MLPLKLKTSLEKLELESIDELCTPKIHSRLNMKINNSSSLDEQQVLDSNTSNISENTQEVK